MHPANDDLVVYLPGEAAKILRTSEWWIKEQARKGRIPYRWLGGGYKFTPDDLRAAAELSKREALARNPDSESAQSRRTPRNPRKNTEGAGKAPELTARIPPRVRRASVNPKAA